jgi:4-hydroxy-3-methylbut-2-enyl diphosphate reductase
MTTVAKVISKLNDFGESFERQHSFYGSPFVKGMIENGGLHVSPRTGVSYHIPTHFGFCYGVEKSIDMAFETTRRFPDRRIFLTHDVIHNPRVNQDLLERGVRVLPRDGRNELVLDGVRPEDIVIVAAFGSKFRDVEALTAKGCVIVDTTCGAIVMVWKRVEKYAKAGHTAVIHGIWDHEETQATASQAVKFGGHFLIVRDLEDARAVAEFLGGGLPAADLMKRFERRASSGFDPARDLARIGIASQTTMLKSETLAVQEFLRGAYRKAFGEAELGRHFMLYDTICSATQERQDALHALLGSRPDLVLVIGGFNSSNTTHLSELASKAGPAYHIQGPEDILSPAEIRHLCPASLREKRTSPWIPAGLKHVGIATGASTPDALIEQVIRRVETCLG